MFDCGKILRKEWMQCIFVAVLALLAAGLLLLLRDSVQKEGTNVLVLVDGREYARYPLAKDGKYMISVGDGEYNVLRIENGSAGVTEASCRNQVCVHTRAIRHAGESINCLPHRLQIRIEGGGQADYDAITN